MSLVDEVSEGLTRAALGSPSPAAPAGFWDLHGSANSPPAHLAFAARFSDELAIVLLEAVLVPVVSIVDAQIWRRDHALKHPSRDCRGCLPP